MTPMAEQEQPAATRNPLHRALALTSQVANKSNDAFLEVAFGLGKSARWTTRKFSEVSGWLRRPKRRALGTLEERLRELLLEERERLQGRPSPEDIGKLAAKLAELLGRIFRGEASVEDIHAVRSLISQSRPLAEFMASQAAPASGDKHKSSIFRRILEDNLRIQEVNAPAPREP